MRKIMAVVATSVLLVSAMGVAIGQGQPPAGGPGGPGGPGGRMGGRPATCPAAAVAVPAPQMLEFMAPRLQLTPEQQASLKVILDAALVARKPLQEKAVAATKAVKDALFAPEFNATSVARLATFAEKAEAGLVTADIATWGQIRGVLTPEQLKMMSQPMGGRGMGGGSNMGGGMPGRGNRGPRAGSETPTPPPPAPTE